VSPRRKSRAKPKPQPPPYEWRVRYRRRWWGSVQVRVFQSAAPAQRLVGKLRRPWDDLEPVVELYVQRRAIGEWQDVQVNRLGRLRDDYPPDPAA
jgi:hypothetical protein